MNLFLVQHTHFFPRGLAEIIGRHSVDELHISLTQGLWKYKNWGYPFHDAGPGAEITAWFNEKVEKSACFHLYNLLQLDCT